MAKRLDFAAEPDGGLCLGPQSEILAPQTGVAVSNALPDLRLLRIFAAVVRHQASPPPSRS